MAKIIIELKPQDVLLFRDGTPLERGSTNEIRSKTMPYPSVFYGAVSAALMQQGYLKSVKDILNSEEKQKEKEEEKQKEKEKKKQEEKSKNAQDELSKRLKINYIFLSDGDDWYLPAPLDLFVDQEGHISTGNFQEGVLYPPEDNQIVSGKSETVCGQYITVNQFLYHYADGETKGISLAGESYFWNYYHKIGLELETGKRITKRSHLYNMELAEMKSEKIAYIIEAELIDMEAESWKEKEWNTVVRLGGLSKTAFLRELDAAQSPINLLEEQNQKQVTSKIIKLIFTTPAIIADVEKLREDFSKEEMQIQLFIRKLGQSFLKENIQLSARVIGKLETIGGYDIVADQQKPIRIGIPAGSILRLESDRFCEGDYRQASKIVEDCLLKVLENTNQGFGKFILVQGD